jgi:hypothetical protein
VSELTFSPSLLPTNFTLLPSFTKPIKEEVKAYTFAHWHEFEGMEWFTPGFIAQIPDEFIPSRNLQQLNDAAVAEGKKEREKRKPTSLSSMKEVVITLTTFDTVSDV